MFGGRTVKHFGVAIGLLAGAGSLSGAAHAADLGGDCCADLEERIAELEATTARKGNRKVSLEVYGQVNEEILWWDDGFENNAGIYTNDNSRSRVGFRGKAKITDDVSAGYRLEIGIRSQNSKRFNQLDPAADSSGPGGVSENGLDLRDSFWFLNSKTYGQVSVGLQAAATDQITEINQTQTADFAKYSDIEDTGGGLFLRATNGALSTLQWRRLIGEGGDQPGEGERRFNLVKYTSPEWKGFTASASWGQDDYGDVALRYKGDWSGFLIAAGIGYAQVTDGAQTKTTAGSRALLDAKQWGGSVSILHAKSGLFVQGGAGQKQDDGLFDSATWANVTPDDEDWFWSIQAGIETKWNTLGKTTVYGQYYDYEGGSLDRRFASTDPLPFANRAIFTTAVQQYGFGVAQGIDAAAMTLYLTYSHVSPEATIGDVGGNPLAGATFSDVALEDYDFVTAGGVIRF
jgi:predicted porin